MDAGCEMTGKDGEDKDENAAPANPFGRIGLPDLSLPKESQKSRAKGSDPEVIGFIGLESSPSKPDSEPSGSTEDGFIGLESSPKRDADPEHKRRQPLEDRAPLQDSPTPVVAPRAIRTIVASVFDVIVEDGSGSIVGEATLLNSLPVVPTVFPNPAFGSVTIPPPNQINPTAAPPHQASPTAASITSPASGPNGKPSISPLPTPGTSLTIKVPNPSSQVILSEPPSTPLPSGQSTSLPPAPGAPNNGTIAPFSHSSQSRVPTNATQLPSQTTFLTQTGTAVIPASLLSSIAASLDSKTASQTGSPNSATSSPSTISGSSQPTGLNSTPTGNGVGGPAASSTGASPAASTTAAAAGGTSSTTVPVIGGVVGGLAGLVLILAMILVLLRWRRRKLEGVREIGSSADTETARPTTDDSRAAMAQNPSGPWAAAGIMPMFKRMRPTSTATSETAPSERGFQKISGRKLPSVLTSGGDGYGDGSGSGSGPPVGQPRGPTDSKITADSFYRDSQGTYGAPISAESSMYVNPGPTIRSVPSVPSDKQEMPGSAYPPSQARGVPDPALSASPPSDSSASPPPNLSSSPPDVVMVRPGPARRPVHSPGFSTPPSSLTPPPARFRDGIGRSHPGFDGSRGSRGSKFAEDLS